MNNDSAFNHLVRSWGGWIDRDGSVCGLSERAQRALEAYEFDQQEDEGERVERSIEQINERDYINDVRRAAREER